MIIKSRFRDYYDHIAHKYGGGDPMVVYMRERVVAHQVHNKGTKDEFKTDSGYNTSRDLFYIPSAQGNAKRLGDSTEITEFRGLGVAGRYYLVVRTCEVTKTELGSLTVVKADQWRMWVPPTEPSGKSFSWSQPRVFVQGQKSEQVLRYSRGLDVPVFAVNASEPSFRSYYQEIDPWVPNLGDHGLPALLPAEQCYQEISMFISNTLASDPDASPPGKQTDVQKAESHGFDRKQSFRHRK